MWCCVSLASKSLGRQALMYVLWVKEGNGHLLSTYNELGMMSLSFSYFTLSSQHPLHSQMNLNLIDVGQLQLTLWHLRVFG